jgi:hypothetical protein
VFTARSFSARKDFRDSPWLHALSIAALLSGLLCALIISIDITRRPQHMMIFNVV